MLKDRYSVAAVNISIGGFCNCGRLVLEDVIRLYCFLATRVQLSQSTQYFYQNAS